MESFLNRYRNLTVLLLVILAQLVLLAIQVKNDQDVRMIRVWTVTAVTPVARIVEGLRGGGSGFLHNYILLHDTNEENRRLKAEVGRLKLENNYLKNELNTADRAKALLVFQAHTPSKAVAATVIGSGAGPNSKAVFVDRGTAAGVERGMAVVTPDGIVGKVVAAYPTASQVLLITDPDFAAGVVSQKGQVRGTLKGQGTPMCKVDYVPVEEKVEVGEWFYTSGDDRIFPRGFPVGVAKAVRNAQPFKEILVEPSGFEHGVEDVLILIEAAHQEIPDTPPANQPVYIAPAPPPIANAGPESAAPGGPAGAKDSRGTEADKLRSQYKAAGDAQGHKFGEGLPGSKPPDFTRLGEPAPAQGTAPAASSGPPHAPAAGAAVQRPDTGAPASEGGRPTAPNPPPAATAKPGTGTAEPGARSPTPQAGRSAAPNPPPAGAGRPGTWTIGPAPKPQAPPPKSKPAVPDPSREGGRGADNSGRGAGAGGVAEGRSKQGAGGTPGGISR